ncbi:TPA: hypothetical protein G9C53_004880 [Salmonella enterica subsp. enterica serovar Typhimurium var. 5-]|uniref:Uncharacterized protein n=1 Tax=Salmonella enterica subsp. enterica serovar Typhimurium var. 5- TaxID=1620419 RepID=A0A740TTC4_SALTM|nr:hypothetical protein [Salmonella enterica subsp. enterica serovar Typhimurium var. 5-]
MASLTMEIEQLFNQLELDKPRPITEIINTIRNRNGAFHKKYSSSWKMKSPDDSSLPIHINQGGVYVFWWMGNSVESSDPLLGPMCTRSYKLQGTKIPGKSNSEEYHQIEIDINDNWLERYKGNIPLYVGKSAESILKRMSLHLQINQPKYRSRSTSDQLRRGIERLFCSHTNTTDLIVQHVGYSFITLHGQDNVVNRFYLENYAIGKLMPLFNIDIER